MNVECPPISATSGRSGPRPWRVLHVETGRYLNGGAQQVVHLVTGLRAHGIESLVACSRGSEVAAALAAVAQHVEELPARGELDWSLTRRLHQIARRAEVDLVHLHSRRGADIFGGLAGRWWGRPVVLSRRVDTPEPRLIAAVKYRLFDRVIAISQCIERVLRGAGVPAAKLRCVSSGIDPTPFSQPPDRAWLCREFELHDSDLVVGLVAQLIPRKGHAVLLDAVEQLRTTHPRLRVLLFGRGPLEASLSADIASRGLATCVRLAGFRPDLPRIVPALDLVVHPALAEGLGVALIQAAAAGVAIVGSRAGGIPEIVRDGENGLLVEPGSAAGLAAAMDRLLSDPPLRRRLGQGGRILVARHFTYDRMVAGNVEVYRELLGSQRELRAAS